MDIRVYDKNLNLVAIIDEYISLIWTDRYCECGDFELCLSANSMYNQYMQDGYFLTCSRSDRVMIVETVESKSDIEEGDKIYINGRSLESILDRRIIWGTRTLDASAPVQGILKDILTEAFLPAGDDDISKKRRVENFEILEKEEFATEPVLDPDLEEGYVYQYTGTELYDVVRDICTSKHMGFVIKLVDSKMQFSIYKGIDRSVESNVGSVIFSKRYDNLLSSDFLTSSRNYKNVSLVGGEEYDNGMRTFAVANTSEKVSGLDRREIFTDAKNVTSSYVDENEQEVYLSEYDYSKLLAETGANDLVNYVKTDAFSGEMDIYGTFVYGVSFNIGDVVQIQDEYDHNKKCRIIEMIHSSDVNYGDTSYPTFKVEE